MAHRNEAKASPAPQALTVPQYVQRKGLHCPFCLSPEIEATSSVEVDGGTATQDIHCLDCAQSWTDVDHLVGYLVTPE